MSQLRDEDTVGSRFFALTQLERLQRIWLGQPVAGSDTRGPPRRLENRQGESGRGRITKRTRLSSLFFSELNLAHIYRPTGAVNQWGRLPLSKLQAISGKLCCTQIFDQALTWACRGG